MLLRHSECSPAPMIHCSSCSCDVWETIKDTSSCLKAGGNGDEGAGLEQEVMMRNDQKHQSGVMKGLCSDVVTGQSKKPLKKNQSDQLLSVSGASLQSTNNRSWQMLRGGAPAG